VNSIVIKIGSRFVSQKDSVFFIAEAGVNHNGDFELAKKLILEASLAGADAVKFQSFDTDSLILEDVKKAEYQIKSGEAGETQSQMLRRLELKIDQMQLLQAYAQSLNIIFLTTPFDELSLDQLDVLDLPAYKIASTDITNLPFLEKVAQKGKPILLSTGMAYLTEIEKALSIIYKYHRQVILLQCTAGYPIDDRDVNLRVMDTYRAYFGVLTGYSDHSKGVGVAPFSVAAGAVVVEKHFTLDKKMSGPDHAASLNPQELKECIGQARYVDQILGDACKFPLLSEIPLRLSLQKNLVAKEVILKGDQFSIDNVVAKRTGGVGISPFYFETLSGKFSPRQFEKGEIIELH